METVDCYHFDYPCLSQIGWAICKRGNGEPGNGESGNRGICKRGNMETTSVTVFKLFLYAAVANSVYHIVRSSCFH